MTFKMKIILTALAIISSLPAFAQCVSGNCEDGYGTVNLENGDRYVGFFDGGYFHGFGSYIFADGDIYIGNFYVGKRSGTGTYIWAEGERYIGHWQNGLRHGIGTTFDVEGNSVREIYQNDEPVDSQIYGCINGDCKLGYGVHIYDDGTIYEGDFYKSRPSGQGTMTMPNGAIYKGEFYKGMFSGFGRLTNPDGTVQGGIWDSGRYLGEVKNQYGCISGTCQDSYSIFVYDDGSYYEGNFKNGNRHGDGTFYAADGEIFSGAWSNDNINGYVTAIYNSEKRDGIARYQGDMKDGNLDGFGSLIYTDNSVYYGQFKNGTRHGQGVLIDQETDKTWCGIWENGKFVEPMDEKDFDLIFGSKNGYGIRLTAYGRYYGNLSDGVPNGKGVIDLYNGCNYAGEFVDGMPNGKGFIENRSTGEKYIGEFKDGDMTGKGVMYLADGTKQEGMFVDGELVTEKAAVQSVEKPQINWITPTESQFDSQQDKIKVKLCVASKTDINSVEVLVNGVVQAKNTQQGIKAATSQCDYTYEFEITLSPGQNQITAKATNDGGTVSSSTKNINLIKSDKVSNDKRLALIIGNGAYQNVTSLANPANDAAAMEAALKSVGFETMTFTNLSQRDMITKIREFGDRLNELKAVGLFFYAGHGLQVNGENYLVPVSADIHKEQDVELECVNLKRVLGEMEYSQNDLNIIILDACRNNPFATMRSAGNGGLAAVNAPKGTFIAFATSPGNTASDGTGQNGLYTGELIKEISQPGLKIEDVFKKVRNNVYSLSQQQQVPWENSSIFGDFYFKK